MSKPDASLEVTQREMSRLPSIISHFVDRILIVSEDRREAAVYKDRASGQPEAHLEVTIRIPLGGEPNTPSWPGGEPVHEQAREFYVGQDGELINDGVDAAAYALWNDEGVTARIVRPGSLEWPEFEPSSDCRDCGKTIDADETDHARLAQVKYRVTLCRGCYERRRAPREDVEVRP